MSGSNSYRVHACIGITYATVQKMGTIALGLSSLHPSLQPDWPLGRTRALSQTDLIGRRALEIVSGHMHIGTETSSHVFATDADEQTEEPPDNQ